MFHDSGMKPLYTSSESCKFHTCFRVLWLKKKKGLEDVEELSDCLLLWIVDVANGIICYFFLWWIMGMGAVCMSNTPPGHKPWGQQGLKWKIGIHHLMASTEWVLSDDWKLWHDAQWGSCINHFRVLRSAAFNIRPVEKLFSQFDSFLLFPLLSAPVVWWSLLVKWWTSKLKSGVSLLFFFFWEKVYGFVSSLVSKAFSKDILRVNQS